MNFDRNKKKSKTAKAIIAREREVRTLEQKILNLLGDGKHLMAKQAIESLAEYRPDDQLGFQFASENLGRHYFSNGKEGMSPHGVIEFLTINNLING